MTDPGLKCGTSKVRNKTSFLRLSLRNWKTRSSVNLTTAARRGADIERSVSAAVSEIMFLLRKAQWNLVTKWRSFLVSVWNYVTWGRPVRQQSCLICRFIRPPFYCCTVTLECFFFGKIFYQTAEKFSEWRTEKQVIFRTIHWRKIVPWLLLQPALRRHPPF